MRALAEYVDFSPMAGNRTEGAAAPASTIKIPLVMRIRFLSIYMNGRGGTAQAASIPCPQGK